MRGRRWYEVFPRRPSFNIYVDPMASAIMEIASDDLDNHANFFADDVILMPQAAQCMQDKWSVAKCTTIVDSSVDLLPLILAGEVMKYAPYADYLGVRICARGVTFENTVESIKWAAARIRALQAVGVRRPRVGTARLRQLYATLVQPVWTYAIHMTPWSQDVWPSPLRYIHERAAARRQNQRR